MNVFCDFERVCKIATSTGHFPATSESRQGSHGEKDEVKTETGQRSSEKIKNLVNNAKISFCEKN